MCTRARAVVGACCLGLFAGSASAQINQGRDAFQRTAEEQLIQQRKERLERERRMQNLMFPYSALPKDAPMLFHLGDREGMQQLFPYYEGLPTYPSNVPGYGGYPGTGKSPDEIEAGKIPGLERSPADKNRWPSWIEGGMGKQLISATPQQAVLVRTADRVWFRPPEERAFIPLVFYDRFRFMTAGSQVEVRGKGEFQLILHAGGDIRSRGPCSMTVTVMDATEVGLQLRDAAQMWIKAGLRPFRVTMPDGTELTFTDTLLHLERRGDRCRVSNLGASPVRFVGSVGTGELVGLMRVRLWMQPSLKAPLGHDFEAVGDVATTRIGQVTTVRGGTGGKVIWSGAAFKVPVGSTLEIKPLVNPRSGR